MSATADAIKTYGRAKETAFQLGKELKELKATSVRLVGQDYPVAEGNSATAHDMDSASQLIDSDNTINAGSNAVDELTKAKCDAHKRRTTQVVTQNCS